jgi:ammonia channel protein AmtB
MVKNAADVIFGGFTYWIFGYAFSFGEDEPMTNFFCGWGNFFVHVENETDIGWVYSKFFFQASFATTATTIVSGTCRIHLEHSRVTITSPVGLHCVHPLTDLHWNLLPGGRVFS